MSNIVNESIFTRKRLEREYDSLMSQYFSHPYAKLPNKSIDFICTNYKVKAIMHVQVPGTGTVDTYALKTANDIQTQLTDMEFDYGWINNSIIRLSLGNIGMVWMDIYFMTSLSTNDIDTITELLERDVIDNYGVVDCNLQELERIHYKLQEVNDEYSNLFGEEIRSLR